MSDKSKKVIWVILFIVAIIVIVKLIQNYKKPSTAANAQGDQLFSYKPVTARNKCLAAGKCFINGVCVTCASSEA